jgi:hypothetical protein
MIIDEVRRRLSVTKQSKTYHSVQLQSLIASGSFTWTRLLWLISTEILRRLLEGLLDSFA